MNRALQLGLVVCLLLAPHAAGAQANKDRVMAPVPPQRPIRARAPQVTPQPQPPAVGVPGAPSGAPVDRSNGAAPISVTDDGLVNLDFQDVELAVVIDTIAKLTNKNFVYDDRVRGRVTIVSPTPVPIDQAYTVFESILQVKGFTTVEAPGGVLKVIPVRDAKETSVDTRRTGGSAATPDTDRFVTRLIPLSYIDADQISNTLKPLVSKEAALVSYQPTNTIILTDSAANIRRILSILEAIDVETFKQELALIRLNYADASVVADQLGELFGVDVVGGGGPGRPGGIASRARARPQPVIPGQPVPSTSPEAAQRGQVRIITDERTNSLVTLASRSTLDEIRDFIRRIDVPVEGGGRIQVYYLKHADAEELADTLNSLLGGGGGGGPGVPGQVTPQIAGQVTEIASGVGTVTADVATNSLLIQANPEGYQALLRVIEQLDIARPQVLVEALIMEVTVGDGQDLGMNWVVRALGGDQKLAIGSRTDSASQSVIGDGTSSSSGSSGSSLSNLASGLAPILAGPTGFLARIAIRDGNDDIIRGVIKAAANDNKVNVLSAPHILTSDNEEAEILVGDNIPIITSRVQSASTTATVGNSTPATSVNVERQDIGVTLRVTPQITEGETMRLDIFQEITALNTALQAGVGDPTQVGPALSNRRIENSVVVKDGETVVIGGLISDDFTDTVNKVPWLGDIPVLGWFFKSTSTNLTKRNLLVFLTPRVIRGADDLEKTSIVKREEFRRHSQHSEKDRPPDEFEEPIGVTGQTSRPTSNDPARGALAALGNRYPIERMLEIERGQAVAKEKARAAEAAQTVAKRYLVLGGVFADPGVAQSTLTKLVDAGYEGTLVSSRSSGRVLLELQIGPYADLEAAERAAEALRLGYALSPQVMVKRAETAAP